MLADLAPAQLEMADRQFFLADPGMIASEAATTMAIARQPTLEITQVLEQGRFIILGQALDRRTELSGLEAVDETLAQELRQAQQDLGSDASRTVVFQNSRGSRSCRSRTRNHDAAKRLRSLKERIRKISGQCENFLRPVVDKGLLELPKKGAFGLCHAG